MKELVAFLLLRQGGNAKPTAEDVTNLLNSVAIEADKEKLEALFKDLENLDVDAAIKEGMDKLAVIPTGGGGGGGAAAPGGGGGDAKEPEPEEEEEESKSSEAGGGDLFGGGGDDSSDEDSSD